MSGTIQKQVVLLLAKAYLIDTRVRNEAESLVERGYRASVISWDRDGRQLPRFSMHGVHVRSLKLLGGKSFSGPAYVISALLLQIFSVCWCIANVKGRYVVHANDFNTLLSGVTLRILLRRNVRLVYDCHELTPSVYAEWYGSLSLGVLMGVIERHLIKYVDQVVTVSPGIRSFLARETRRNARIVYNTPRQSLIPKETKNDLKRELSLQGFVVSFVGYIRRDAALDELVSIAREFEKRGVKDISFVVVGSGPDWNRIQSISAGLGNFQLLPNKPYELALRYVKASDVTLAVYRYSEFQRDASAKKHWLFGGSEALTMHWKVTESMACESCPIIRRGTVDWTFASGFGFGIDAGTGTEQEITTALGWALRNPDKVAYLARVGHSKYLEEFNWDKMIDSLVEVYEA